MVFKICFMKIPLFILLLVFSYPDIRAQVNIDSLWTIYNDDSVPDVKKAQALIKIAGDGYLFSKPDSAFYFAQMLYSFAKERGLNKVMASSLNIQGASFSIRSNYPKALDYYLQSLKIHEEISNKNGMVMAMNNIGVIFKIQGDYPKALFYYLQSLKINKKISNKKGEGGILNNIGLIYELQGYYSKALDYYLKSLRIREEISNNYGIATSLNNIGGIYMLQGNFSKALDYYLRSLKINEEILDKNGIALVLNNIAGIYAGQYDYPKALNFYLKSLKIREEISNKRGMAGTLIDIGKIYLIKNDYSEAVIWCEKGLYTAEQISILKEQKEACMCLYKAFKGLGNGNKALKYHEKILVFYDSLQSAETKQKLQQMEFAKQVLADSLVQATKDVETQHIHELEVQKKNRAQNISIVVGFFILLFAGGLYSRLRYVRKSRAEISMEKDRSDNLLLNILPAEIAEELKQNGKAQARDFNLVSILFTDFKGFTEASAKMSAALLVGEINACFEAFDGIMEKYQIEKIKTIGDSYMSAGGLPVPTDNSVKNTILAALEMQTFITKRKADNEAQNKPAFEMRVGIHTGPVVAGIVGVKKFQYDIWGDTVNTASRMESSGEVGKVNISGTTYDLVKDKFICTHRGKIKAKGKGEIDMYFVDQSL
jgi:adenylate cyclase